MVYNQIEVTEESAKILAINTSKGIYKFNCMAFGITVATSIFQRIMEKTLQGLKSVVCFLDNIVVSGRNMVEHNKNLEMVFERLQEAGFTLRKDKCKFFEKEIPYLGYKITSEGIKKADDKVTAIVKAERPSNTSEVRSFIGTVNFY